MFISSLAEHVGKHCFFTLKIEISRSDLKICLCQSGISCSNVEYEQLALKHKTEDT